MKKHLALVLALVMVLGSFSFVSAAPDFSDVKGTSFEDAVTRLESLNVLKGYPDGTFKPADTITRAEFAAVAVRVSGLEQAAMAAKGLPTGFSDVPAWHWAAGYVGTAAKLGIVNGVGNGMFAPETPVKYEEAVTMLVRALGYEPAAQAKGGYPFGYLIVANETDLLAGALGTQGTWATRGFVAQITDNALEIEMMVQVGYGTDIRYEVSNKDNGGVKYLFDKMGFDTFEGRVTSFNDSKNKITIKGDDNETLDVADGFDFYEVYGVTIKIWAKDDKVVAYTLKDDVKFDAVEVDGNDLILIEEDESYDVANDAKYVIDGDSVKLSEFPTVLDYAKVVFDDDGDVIWLEGFTLPNFLVFEKLDGDDVLGYGDEFDAKDFTVVKDGKTIDLEDLAKGDIVFYNTTEEFANVYNNSVKGEITRIYTDRITVEKSDYKFEDANAKYLNEDGEISKFTTSNFEDVVEAMEESGDVEVFLNREGNMVFLAGDLGDLVTSSSYVMVTKTSSSFSNRGTLTWTLDVINAEGEEVKYDIKDSDVNSTTKSKLKSTTGASIVWTSSLIDAKTVVELVIDKDGAVKEVRMLDEETVPSSPRVKTSSKYFAGYKINSDAPAFLVEDFTTDVDDIDVTTYSKLDFDFIDAGTFYREGTKIVGLVIEDSNREDESTDHMTVATADDTKVSGKNIWRLKLVIDRVKASFDTKEDITDPEVVKGDFLKVAIDDNTGKVNVVNKVTDTAIVVENDLVSEVSSSNDTLKIGTELFRLGVDNVIVDATDSYKVISLSNLKTNDTVRALRVAAGSSYVEVIVRTAKAGDTAPITGDYDLTATNATSGSAIKYDFKATVRSNDTATNFAVLIDGNAYVLDASGEVTVTLAESTLVTAKLVKISSPSVILKEISFVTPTL